MALHVSTGKLAEFSDMRFNGEVPFQNERVKVVVATFREGQFIPVHTPDADLVAYVIEGKAEIVGGDTSYEASAGDLVVVEAGEARGIRARTPLRVLHVVTPPPTEADHKQVYAGLQQGRFRPE